jgi:hypothetical protein
MYLFRSKENVTPLTQLAVNMTIIIVVILLLSAPVSFLENKRLDCQNVSRRGRYFRTRRIWVGAASGFYCWALYQKTTFKLWIAFIGTNVSSTISQDTHQWFETNGECIQWTFGDALHCEWIYQYKQDDIRQVFSCFYLLLLLNVGYLDNQPLAPSTELERKSWRECVCQIIKNVWNDIL